MKLAFLKVGWQYLILQGILQSICASFPPVDAAQKKKMRLRTVNVVRSLQKIMGQLSNLSSEADHYEPCAADNPAWTAEVEQIATSAVKDATSRLNTSSWVDRQRLHELVANGTVKMLNHNTYKDG